MVLGGWGPGTAGAGGRAGRVLWALGGLSETLKSGPFRRSESRGQADAGRAQRMGEACGLARAPGLLIWWCGERLSPWELLEMLLTGDTEHFFFFFF